MGATDKGVTRTSNKINGKQIRQRIIKSVDSNEESIDEYWPITEDDTLE